LDASSRSKKLIIPLPRGVAKNIKKFERYKMKTEMNNCATNVDKTNRERNKGLSNKWSIEKIKWKVEKERKYREMRRNRDTAENKISHKGKEKNVNMNEKKCLILEKRGDEYERNTAKINGIKKKMKLHHPIRCRIGKVLSKQEKVFLKNNKKEIIKNKNKTQPQSPIHNISSYNLSELEVKVLSKGLNFAITPTENKKTENTECAINDFIRRIKLKVFFHERNKDIKYRREKENDIKIKGLKYKTDKTFIPEIECELFNKLTSNFKTKFMNNVKNGCEQKNKRQNMKNYEMFALKKLMKNPEIIIKPADKNMGITIMNKSWYEEKGFEFMDDERNYRVINDLEIKTVKNKIRKWVLQNKDNFPEKDLKYITDGIEAAHNNPCKMYFLPKLHKNPVGIRPICSSCGYATESSSKFLDYHLRPLLKLTKTYLKDSQSLIKIMSKIKCDKEVLIATYDVQNLYPSIEIERGIYAVTKYLMKNCKKNNTNPQTVLDLIDLLRVVLKNNYVRFGGKTYLQISGTAMGTPVAVVFSILFMSSLDEKLEESYNLTKNLKIHFRYIDDGFVIWSGTKSELEEWLAKFNQLDDKIKLTWEISDKKVDFLDCTFYKSERFQNEQILDTTTYQKPMNKYQYLHRYSCHPEHCKNSFISGEIRRYLIRESSESNFHKRVEDFFERLRKRGYSENYLKKFKNRMEYKERESIIKKINDSTSTQKSHSIPFIIPFTPATVKFPFKLLHEYLDDISKIQKYSQIFANDELTVAYIIGKKIRNFIVKS
jgi:hypothetical protein